MARHRASLLLLAAVLFIPTTAAALYVAPQRPGIAVQQVQAAPKVVVLPGNEVRNARVATTANELGQVLFADGTTISLAPDSEVNIESFEYDPASGRATLSATLARGVFRFIGHATSSTPDGVSLTTPYGTLSVDRAVVDISLGGGGDEPPHFDLLSGTAIILSRGGAVAARAHRGGYSIVPDQGGAGATVRKTPAEWRSSVLDRLQ